MKNNKSKSQGNFDFEDTNNGNAKDSDIPKKPSEPQLSGGSQNDDSSDDPADYKKGVEPTDGSAADNSSKPEAGNQTPEAPSTPEVVPTPQPSGEKEDENPKQKKPLKPLCKSKDVEFIRKLRKQEKRSHERNLLCGLLLGRYLANLKPKGEHGDYLKRIENDMNNAGIGLSYAQLLTYRRAYSKALAKKPEVIKRLDEAEMGVRKNGDPLSVSTPAVEQEFKSALEDVPSDHVPYLSDYRKVNGIDGPPPKPLAPAARLRKLLESAVRLSAKGLSHDKRDALLKKDDATKLSNSEQDAIERIQSAINFLQDFLNEINQAKRK